MSNFSVLKILTLREVVNYRKVNWYWNCKMVYTYILCFIFYFCYQVSNFSELKILTLQKIVTSRKANCVLHTCYCQKFNYANACMHAQTAGHTHTPEGKFAGQCTQSSQLTCPQGCPCHTSPWSLAGWALWTPARSCPWRRWSPAETCRALGRSRSAGTPSPCALLVAALAPSWRSAARENKW